MSAGGEKEKKLFGQIAVHVEKPESWSFRHLLLNVETFAVVDEPGSDPYFFKYCRKCHEVFAAGQARLDLITPVLEATKNDESVFPLLQPRFIDE